jgi:hypothetical protein
MFITPLFQRIIIGFAAFTALGVLVHDTKFDQAVALALPVATITIGIGAHALDFGDSAHTHVEKASFAHAFAGTPRIQPRDDHRRYLMSKSFSRSTDNFGGSQILWPSI